VLAWQRSGLLSLSARNWRDEAVAATRDVLDEAVAVPPVAKSFSESGDMNAQGGLVYDRVGPDAVASWSLRTV
jgi:hypothetical protein